MNYKELGLKSGLEFHQRLDTNKLFCNCESGYGEEKVNHEILRKLRPVAGELGEIDPAAVLEFARDKTFDYQTTPRSTCLVEMDEEPPHEINPEAIDIALEIALLLDCDIVDELHVMRKTVIDGSNTAGFQRTMMIGHSGYLDTPYGKIPITNVFLEEEAAGIVKEKKGVKTYRLDRLGIPLVEIATGIMELTPTQVKDVALRLGQLLRVTGKVQRGIGTIRQDVNVSVKGGARVEIKGAQELRILHKIIDNEIKRQLEMIKKGKKPQEETRRLLLDGSTEYMRPLPGAARLYPETDIPPVLISPQRIKEVKAMLPEHPEETLKKLKKKYKLSDELASRMLTSRYALQFYDITNKVFFDPNFVANTFLNTMKALRREGFDVNKIAPTKIRNIFKAVKEKKLPRAAVPNILKRLAKRPDLKVKEVVKEVEMISEDVIEKEIDKLIKKDKELLKDKRKAFRVLMGEVMDKYKGKIEGNVVAKLLKKKIK